MAQYDCQPGSQVVGSISQPPRGHHGHAKAPCNTAQMSSSSGVMEPRASQGTPDSEHWRAGVTGFISHPSLSFLEHFCCQWMWEKESKHMHEVSFSHQLKFKLMPIPCLGKHHGLEQSLGLLKIIFLSVKLLFQKGNLTLSYLCGKYMTNSPCCSEQAVLNASGNKLLGDKS